LKTQKLILEQELSQLKSEKEKLSKDLQGSSKNFLNSEVRRLDLENVVKKPVQAPIYSPAPERKPIEIKKDKEKEKIPDSPENIDLNAEPDPNRPLIRKVGFW